MQKILVTTDFSTNSKAGLRFAIQLATQNNYELTFFHAYFIMPPAHWSDFDFKVYEQAEKKKIQLNLELFVEKVYKSMDLTPKNPKCVIQSSVFTTSGIREYAFEKKFNFICISTRGAGKLKKILGTNTANLITHSAVPVIAVPGSYRVSKILKILYASDLANIKKELNRVVRFAEPLKAKVEMVHFNSAIDLITNIKVLKSAIKKFSGYEIKLHLEQPDLFKTLISNLESVIKKTNPSIVIMFTEQNRSFFEKIFLASKSAELTFNLKKPLLVFNKA